MGIITTGSEYPPQQSAKQTAGSGLCKAYARRSSPTLNFVAGFKSACSHFKHPQMWPNKLSQDKGLQIVTQQAQDYIVLAREGAGSWFERTPLRKTNFHQIAGIFFPSWWSTNSCRAWVDFGFQKTKDFLQKYLSRTVGTTAKNWMLDCLCTNRKGSHFICCLHDIVNSWSSVNVHQWRSENWFVTKVKLMSTHINYIKKKRCDLSFVCGNCGFKSCYLLQQR
jgi:hypothetical protein